MKTKIWLWIFVVISVVSTTALITMSVGLCDKSSCNNSFRSDLKKHHRRGHLSEKLNLTEDQKQLFDVEKAKHCDASKPIFDSILETREVMLDELKKTTPNMFFVDSCVSKIAYYEGKIQKETATHILNMKSFLNSVQIDTLFNFFKDKMIPCSGKKVRHCEKHSDCH